MIGALVLAAAPIVIREILPPVPRREGEGCWPVRVLYSSKRTNLTVRVKVQDGDRVVATRSGKARGANATIAVPCHSEALRFTYALEFSANGRPVEHTFLSPNAVPPPPPPLPDETFEHRCDVHFFREPVTPRIPPGDIEITAMRVQGYADGAPRFHDYLVHETKPVPPEMAAEIVRILNDPRTYACDGMGCLATGLAFRIRAGDRTIDLGVCLECQYLHLLPGHDHIPLSERGKRELTEIYTRLFRVP